MPANRRILFARRPQGLPVPEDFGADSVPCPEPGPGQFLARTVWLSLDPYLRNVMKGHALYGVALRPGDPMHGETVARVVESRHPQYASGDWVVVRNGWQEYGLSDGQGVRPLDPALAPPSTALGVLGMPGLTGYAGLVGVGQPRAGQTVLVSAATGPVGSTVGQVARLMGARAIGIAGSADKRRYAVEALGFEACVDRHSADLAGDLRRACPDGVDVYFDNAGGAVLEAALAQLTREARVVLCGMIDAYNRDGPPAHGPFLGPVVAARASLHGFVVYDHLERFAEFQHVVGGWIREGRFHYREDISEGLDSAPAAFCRLMRGENFGKSLVRVGPD